MKVLSFGVLPILLLITMFNKSNAQCNSWVGSPRENEAKEAHVLYRQMVKGKTAADLTKMDDGTFTIIYENWQKAYELAPMADGQRANHYVDGVEILKARRDRSTVETVKKEADKSILALYDQMVYVIRKRLALL